MVNPINLAKDAPCTLPFPVLISNTVVVVDSAAALSLFTFLPWIPKLTIDTGSSIVSLHHVVLKIFFRSEGLHTQLFSIQDTWKFKGLRIFQSESCLDFSPSLTSLSHPVLPGHRWIDWGWLSPWKPLLHHEYFVHRCCMLWPWLWCGLSENWKRGCRPLKCHGYAKSHWQSWWNTW